MNGAAQMPDRGVRLRTQRVSASEAEQSGVEEKSD